MAPQRANAVLQWKPPTLSRKAKILQTLAHLHRLPLSPQLSVAAISPVQAVTPAAVYMSMQATAFHGDAAHLRPPLAVMTIPAAARMIIQSVTPMTGPA